MTRTLKALFPFVVLASGLAYAQMHQPPDPAQRIQHRVDFLTRELGLSSGQQQQATTIFTNAASGEKSLHDQMKAAHETLQAAVTRNDSAGIDQAAGSIGGLMAQSVSTHAKADAAFYQILTPDQQTKYTQMRSHDMFFMRGPGLEGHPPF